MDSMRRIDEGRVLAVVRTLPALLLVAVALLTLGCYSSNSIIGSSDAGTDPHRPDPTEIHEPPCVPDCTGRECGDDGCGGTCGVCPSGRHCFAGNCTCSDCAWCPMDFDAPTDSISCDGDRFVRYDETYELWVGLVQCPIGYRFYISRPDSEHFYPVCDCGGHGQDFCELMDPGFRIYNPDDITSGGCTECSIGAPFSLSGSVWWRCDYGQPFEFDESVGEWWCMTSWINCAVDISIEPGATLFCP